ncbi:atrial natriuretic peptide-converting enzyme-like isoform X2 [Lycorma delicatula]|uniref:atrial natriuretic peptide-converting enzyme-like isoform X2 n=1 Tax=Lycorma delicatula TaxID=130591 RepID=UPI003F514A6E
MSGGHANCSGRRHSSATHYNTEYPFGQEWIQNSNDSTRNYRAASLVLPAASCREERSLLEILMQNDENVLGPALGTVQPAPIPPRRLPSTFPTKSDASTVSSSSVLVPPPVPARQPPAVPERMKPLPPPTSRPPPPPIQPRTRVGPPFNPPRTKLPEPPSITHPDLDNHNSPAPDFHNADNDPRSILRRCSQIGDKQPPPRPQPPPVQARRAPPPLPATNEDPSIGSCGKISVRQDSNVSSDSFSQNSSPSYTTKSMETPLLGGKTSRAARKGCRVDQNGSSTETRIGDSDTLDENGSNLALTKSHSTPASLQTIVRFHQAPGSNMSLHHRIIRDIRRPSNHYITRGRLRFQFAQVILNAIALLAIAGGLAAYFRAYPSTVRYVNKTVTTTRVAVVPPEDVNPAPGICLPVIVTFCQQHRVPYNFTMFPNYIGHFTQRDAQQELEVYDAVVDVRCYELAALFLCSVFVPKCGPSGQLVRPCRSLCLETRRRCGFFLDVFGLSLPDYLICELFPESSDPDKCVGHNEVNEAEIRAQKPVCLTGFQCDVRRCIPADWRCDGHVDCEDQSDELSCSQCAEGMIHCGANTCMAQSHMCDGVVDCPWGQDERNCIRLSEKMGDEGKGKVEVFQPELQSWRPACVQNLDQKTSPKAICSLLGYKNVTSSSITVKDLPVAKFTPSLRRQHHKTRSNLLNELRTCSNSEAYSTIDLHCTDYACGMRRQLPERPQKRIVGGVESTPGDWPFLAALLGGPEQVFYCAGVLISDQWVLTASHCVGNFTQGEPTGWTIQLGITRRHAHSYFGQKVKVKRVLPHPMYNMGVAHDNDVALFQLQFPVTFHEHLLPVCLPPANYDLVPGTVCTVIGWGKREDTDVSEYEAAVNEVQVPVLNRDLCNVWLEHRDLNVTQGMICAGYAEGGKDACQGDSGGPLLCRTEENKDRWFVGGIVSWGIKCAHPHLPVFK